MEVYGCNVVVPTLVVEGQCDDLILGSNVLRYLIGQLKTTKGLMKVVFASEQNCTDGNRLISMVANVERWRGGDVPDKVSTLRLKQAVTLEPMQEHLMWGRLRHTNNLSVGSTVVTEPSSLRSKPKTILVGRTVALLHGDGWLPVRVINPSHKSVTLRRNAT